MRGFKNFKGSDARCPSIHFLFYGKVANLLFSIHKHTVGEQGITSFRVRLSINTLCVLFTTECGRFAKTVFYFLRADAYSSYTVIIKGKAVNLGDGEGKRSSMQTKFHRAEKICGDLTKGNQIIDQ